MPIAVTRSAHLLDSFLGQKNAFNLSVNSPEAANVKRYLPDDILTKVDRMSMAVSLEARVPFLDHRIVEFAFGLPPQLRLRRGTGKYLLKRLLERYLPTRHVYRYKRGFGMPLSNWFRGELRDPLLDVLSPQAIRDVGLFNPDRIQHMLEMHWAGRLNFAKNIWRVFVAQVWAQHSFAHGI